VIAHGDGFTFHKKIGDKEKKGEPIYTITHHAYQEDIVTGIQKKFIKDVLVMSALKVKSPKLILDKLS
jgi:thymidine phosphorylase